MHLVNLLDTPCRSLQDAFHMHTVHSAFGVDSSIHNYSWLLLRSLDKERLVSIMWSKLKHHWCLVVEKCMYLFLIYSLIPSLAHAATLDTIQSWCCSEASRLFNFCTWWPKPLYHVLWVSIIWSLDQNLIFVSLRQATVATLFCIFCIYMHIHIWLLLRCSGISLW